MVWGETNRGGWVCAACAVPGRAVWGEKKINARGVETPASPAVRVALSTRRPPVPESSHGLFWRSTMLFFCFWRLRVGFFRRRPRSDWRFDLPQTVEKRPTVVNGTSCASLEMDL